MAGSAHFRTVHLATGTGFDHPLGYLEEPSFVVRFQTAPVYGAPMLYNFSVNPDRTPTPRMPRITDLSRLRTMGILLSACTTRTAPISDSGRQRPTGELVR